MKTILEKATRDELICRISTLNNDSSAQWGKMNVYQMVKHCMLWDEMIFGKQAYKRTFIGRIFGKMALNIVLKNDKPLAKNTPTIPEFRIKEEGDVLPEKAKWIALIEKYAFLSVNDFIHPFLGKMTNEQIGYLAFKHADHHLRQFNS
jgi:Protein of unknown function (DUF1569)